MLNKRCHNWMLPGLLALLLGAGCTMGGEEKGTDSASGGDHKRDLAKKVPLNRTITDSVSAPKGDHTDWKYIDIEEEGTLKIMMSVDNPNISGAIFIFDELGEALQRTTINAKETSYDFEFPVEAGKKYYIKMGVSKYESVYSVGNQFEKKVEASVVAITPEPDPVRVVSTPRRKVTVPDKQPDPPIEPVDATKIVVTSSIVSVIPMKDGKASRITFKQGTDQGIKRGAVVAISTGGNCIVKEVFPVASVCIVDKPTEEFKEGTRVVITSDR